VDSIYLGSVEQRIKELKLKPTTQAVKSRGTQFSYSEWIKFVLMVSTSQVNKKNITEASTTLEAPRNRSKRNFWK
jgi:hypothetical protein